MGRCVHRWTPSNAEPGRRSHIGKTILLVWRLEGVPGFWPQRSQNAATEIAAFWTEYEPRKRKVSTALKAYALLASSAAKGAVRRLPGESDRS